MLHKLYITVIYANANVDSCVPCVNKHFAGKLYQASKEEKGYLFFCEINTNYIKYLRIFKYRIFLMSIKLYIDKL